MSKHPVLTILAAGMGSRYGGLKQMDPMDGFGNLIIDFDIYDALRAGFDGVVFIIKREMEEDFRAVIGDRIARHADVYYAHQQLDMLPEGFSVPGGRVKPWGTTHAVLCARDAIAGRPFAIINADDYYGPAAFAALHGFLTEDRGDNEHALVGYDVQNTITEHGSVTRGVCPPVNGLTVSMATPAASPIAFHGDSPCPTGQKNFRSSSISAQIPW